MCMSDVFCGVCACAHVHSGIKVWSYYFQLFSYIVVCFLSSPQMLSIKSKCKKDGEGRKAQGNRKAGCRAPNSSVSTPGRLTVTCRCTVIDGAGTSHTPLHTHW